MSPVEEKAFETSEKSSFHCGFMRLEHIIVLGLYSGSAELGKRGDPDSSVGATWTAGGYDTAAPPPEYIHILINPKAPALSNGGTNSLLYTDNVTAIENDK